MASRLRVERGKEACLKLALTLFSLFLEELLNQGFAFGRKLG